MGVLNKTATAMSSFARMARGLASPRAELPRTLFPVGESRGWEGLMRAAGVKAIAFGKRDVRKDSGVSGWVAGQRPVMAFELAIGERDFAGHEALINQLESLANWAARTGLRLELREEGAVWVAPSKRAAAETQWQDCLSEESLSASAEIASRIARGLPKMQASLARHQDFPEELREEAGAFRRKMGGS